MTSVYNYGLQSNLLVGSFCRAAKALLLLATCAVVTTSNAFALTNQNYSKELARYVENGNVEYAKWTKKPAALQSYLDSLAALSQQDYDQLQPEEQKALWINAYNAITIKLVLDHYPIQGTNKDFPPNSFRQIPDAWEKVQYTVAGRVVTLEDIEHTILRRDFHDPRTHFIIVCAAKGSPQVLNHALCGKNLEPELEKAKAEFLSDPKNVSFDAQSGVLSVSKIFEWFPLDFACAEWFKRNKGKLPNEETVIVEYLKKNGTPELQHALQEAIAKNPGAEKPVKVTFKTFDWSLNELQ
jgi:Protein of unknown function, DUF547